MIEADALAVHVKIDPIGAGRNDVGALVGQMVDEYDFIADHHFLRYMDDFDGDQIVIALRCFLKWRGIRRRREQKKRLT